MAEDLLTGVITMTCGKRAILQTKEGHIFVLLNSKVKGGDRVSVKYGVGTFACPSMLFAISILYSENPSQELADLEKENEKHPWGW